MLWIVLTVVSLVVLIASIFFGFYDVLDFESLWCALIVITTISVLICGFTWLVQGIGDPQSVEMYKSKYTWFATHSAENGLEDLSLTQQKLNLNNWLYHAQYAKENRPLWNFYPDEILDLKPIE